MGDYGMAISQKGYDASNCADRFLAYSSAFEGLKIFSKTTFAGNGGVITISHNLGYFAPFIVFLSTGAISPGGKQYTDHFEINTSVGSTYTVFLFENDFSAVAGRNINAGLYYGTPSNDYGIRISKPGYDANNCTDDQLMLSSSFFTNLIHQKGNFKPAPDNGYGSCNTYGSVAHNLGYVPDFFMYLKYDADSFITSFMTGGDGFAAKINATELDAGVISDYSLQWYHLDTTFYYIIFKNRVL